MVITAETDPLREEGEAYARKLKAEAVTDNAVRNNGGKPIRLSPD